MFNMFAKSCSGFCTMSSSWRQKSEVYVTSISFLGFTGIHIQMDPSKVSAVSDWPSPTSRKQLQCFLGFVNFYRRFIWNFSSIAALLHALTSLSVKFQWTPQAEQSILRLKNLFNTGPILTLTDPRLQFVVEVDASKVGVGDVRSQRSAGHNELHSCTFLCWKLSPAERNYDVGNRELLAVKVDHKNLEFC